MISPFRTLPVCAEGHLEGGWKHNVRFQSEQIAIQAIIVYMIRTNSWAIRLLFVAVACVAFLSGDPARAQAAPQTAPATAATATGPSDAKPAAQTPGTPPAATAGQAQPAPQDPNDSRESAGFVAPTNDRLFGVLPNYTTVENEDRFGPLGVKDKFKLAKDSAVDPVTFPFIGFIALLGQAENSEPSYGQGLKGYAKRYGTSYGDAIIGTFMTTAVYPSVLRQDPRYFQLGHGSFGHRMLYSASRLFWTRTDSGKHEFNYSEIVGNLTAAGISNIYHPPDDRGFGNTVNVWATDIMWDGVANISKEFWPDIRRKLYKKHND